MSREGDWGKFPTRVLSPPIPAYNHYFSQWEAGTNRLWLTSIHLQQGTANPARCFPDKRVHLQQGRTSEFANLLVISSRIYVCLL